MLPAVQAITPPPIVQLAGSVFPAAGGTRRDPVATSVKLGFTLNKESGSTVKRVTWELPRGVALSGRGFPRCSPGTASRDRCPEKALVGTGRLSLRVGAELSQTDFDVDVYTDGARTLRLALVAPDYTTVVAAQIRGRTLRVRLPVALQRPQPATYTYLTNFSLALGPARARGNDFATLSGCRAPHRYAVTVGLARNPAPPTQSTATATDSSPCR